MCSNKLSSHLFAALLFVLTVGESVAQPVFRVGAWCFLQDPPQPQPILEVSPNVWRVLDHERGRLLELGFNYFIACTGLNAEQAMAFMGDSLNAAAVPYEFESTLEWSPANASSGVPYQVWASIDLPGGPGDPTWEARVDNGFTAMNTLYAGSDGVHSFLAAAESQLYDPGHHVWAEWIADAVHRNAPGVLATVQTSPPVNLDLLMQTVQSADFLQHWNYPFTAGLPYSGEPFQTALQGSVTEYREAIASLVAHLPGAPFYAVLRAHLRPGVRRAPTMEEILCQANLALAYGANGIIYYLYAQAGNEQGLLDFNRNPTPRYAMVEDIDNDYQGTGQSLIDVGASFLSLTWQDGFSVHQVLTKPISTAYDLHDVTATVPGGASDDPDETYVEVGVLQDGSSVNHYMVVNRRCGVVPNVAADEIRDITVEFDSTANHAYLITDQFTGTEKWFLPADDTTIPYTFTLDPGEGKLLRLEDLGTWSGTISSNTTWSGAVCANGDILVSSGVTLTVAPGTAVMSGADDRLTINGSLQAVGTAGDPITFTSAVSSPSAGDWDGIFIQNDDGSTIDHCTIEYAAFGVYANNPSELTIENSTIHNGQYGIYLTNTPFNTVDLVSNSITQNGYYGMYLYSGADPDIGLNTISSNTLDGIRCVSNSDPRIRSHSPNADYGNNWIHSNGGAGVKAATNSYPELGYNTLVAGLKDYYGYNTIYGNGPYEVDNSNSSNDSVFAKRNYWSADHEGTPDSSDFKGVVAYKPFLGGSPSLVAGAGGNALSKLAISFEPALQLEIDEQYEQAAKLYLSLLEQNSDASNAGYGGSGVIRCYKSMKQPGRILPTLQDLIGAFGGTALESSAQDHALPFLLQRRDYATALAYADTLLQRNLGAESKEPHYLYQLASIYLAKSGSISGNDLNGAIASFDQLRQKYPESDLAFIAAYDVRPFTGASLPRSSPATQKIAEQPLQFELRSNYPNPFNPTTTIEFALPEPSTVTLKVYNVLGVEVATLLSNHELEAGIHHIDFDAAGLSGGLYFCRLITPDYRETRKMTLLR